MSTHQRFPQTTSSDTDRAPEHVSRPKHFKSQVINDVTMIPNEVPARSAAAISAKRVVTRNGVHLDGLAYNCRRLLCVARGHTVALLGLAHDVGYVVVGYPWTGVTFKVPAVDQAYAAGMRRDVHRLNRVIARRLYGEGARRAHLRQLKPHVEALVIVARARQRIRRARCFPDQEVAFNALLLKAPGRLDK